jgi:hypothetical protein
VSRDPNLTKINNIESLVKGNIVGKHIMIISQEEGREIWINEQKMIP